MAPFVLNENVLPGNIIVSRRSMRSWISFGERGVAGRFASENELFIIVHVAMVGNHVRLGLLGRFGVEMFSTRSENFKHNWEVIKDE